MRWTPNPVNDQQVKKVFTSSDEVNFLQGCVLQMWELH